MSLALVSSVVSSTPPLPYTTQAFKRVKDLIRQQRGAEWARHLSFFDWIPDPSNFVLLNGFIDV